MPTHLAHLLHWLPHPRNPEDGTPYKHRWAALLVICLGIFLIALDMTVVGVAAPSLSKALGATASQIQWVFDTFTIMVGGFVVLAGGLAERFGRKAFLQCGMLAFAAGCTLSAFAPNMNIMLLGRIVSGLSAAMVFPAVLSMISSLFEPAERHRAVAIFASTSALGLTSGPLIGGALISWFWWGAAFLAVVPVAVVGTVLIAWVVPPSRGVQDGPLDWFGALLSVLGLGGFVFGLIEGPGRGWDHVLVLVPFGIGVIATIAFIFWELHVKSPLLDLRAFKDKRVVGGALAMATVYFTLNTCLLLLPQYCVYVLNQDSFQAGLMMIPLGLALVSLSPFSGNLSDRFGQRKMLIFCLTFMTAGMAVLAFLPFQGGVLHILLGTAIYAIGFGLIVAPATSIIMIAIPKEKAGHGSGINMVSRQIGGSLGVAICGSIAALVYRAQLSLSSFHLSPEATSQAESSLSGIIAVRGKLSAKTADALNTMADRAMTVGVGFAVGTCALFAFLVALLVWFAVPKRSANP